MDFMELVAKRHSVRKYAAKPVEKEILDMILEAGRIAPTASNRQPLRITVVQSSEGLLKIKKAAKIFDAPLALIVSADHEQIWRRSYDGKGTGDIDASIVTTYMMFRAVELGLGTVWICHFEPSVLKAEFDLPDNLEPVNILVAGYAAVDDEPNPRHFERKELDKLVRYE
ncbi:MAG: nitroreductase family protein [Prevotellaceae bacterium]|jgi:nitroreductase|nr:nitroreductase family protein [Prevotellaceae bacterium]